VGRPSLSKALWVEWALHEFWLYRLPPGDRGRHSVLSASSAVRRPSWRDFRASAAGHKCLLSEAPPGPWRPSAMSPQLQSRNERLNSNIVAAANADIFRSYSMSMDGRSSDIASQLSSSLGDHLLDWNWYDISAHSAERNAVRSVLSIPGWIGPSNRFQPGCLLTDAVPPWCPRNSSNRETRCFVKLHRL
jgi:hypothetical protein